VKILAALILFGGVAQAALVDDFLAKLETSSRTVQSLSGEFTQRNKLALFKQELKSKGRFHFKRPRQIRWEYLDPDPSVLILDGDKASLRTPGAATQTFDLAKDATMRAVFDQLLLWLGSGSLTQARGDYEMTVNGATLTLLPKTTSPVAKAFIRIELRFDERSLLLKSIFLVEKNGDEKEIVFTRLDKNPTLPPDAFK
jgi:chaperone LolA